MSKTNLYGTEKNTKHHFHPQRLEHVQRHFMRFPFSIRVSHTWECVCVCVYIIHFLYIVVCIMLYIFRELDVMRVWFLRVFVAFFLDFVMF